MKKLIVTTTVLALALMSSISAQATGVAGDAKVPHVTGSGSNPNNANFYPSTYYFGLHIAG